MRDVFFFFFSSYVSFTRHNFLRDFLTSNFFFSNATMQPLGPGKRKQRERRVFYRRHFSRLKFSKSSVFPLPYHNILTFFFSFIFFYYKLRAFEFNRRSCARNYTTVFQQFYFYRFLTTLFLTVEHSTSVYHTFVSRENVTIVVIRIFNQCLLDCGVVRYSFLYIFEPVIVNQLWEINSESMHKLSA